MSPLTRLYLAFSQVSGPLWRWNLRKRLKKGKEDPRRVAEKHGENYPERPAGDVFWFHALSVGESLALVPLIELALDEYPDAHVVVTTSTRTSIAALENARLPKRAIHVLLPVDTVWATKQFLDYWHPRVAVFSELDFWPRLMFETYKRGIPLILINSRLSTESFIGRKRLGGLMRDVLGLFSTMLVQDEASVDRFTKLGADPSKVIVSGALKAAARPLPVDEGALADWKQKLGVRPVWLAAATRDIEEKSVLRAHARVLEVLPNALLVVAPRFLESADALEEEARKMFDCVVRRSRSQDLVSGTQVYIADTIGEMGLWYRLAPVSFVGHSLGPPGKPLGGKNPFEAAALNSAIIHGRAVEDFEESYAGLHEQNAAVQVDSVEHLSDEILRLMNPRHREDMLKGANDLIADRGAVLGITWDAISKVLRS